MQEERIPHCGARPSRADSPEPLLTATASPPAAASVGPRNGADLRDFAQPTVVDGLRALAAVVGAPEALRLWSQAALVTGVHGQDVSLDDHVRLVQHLGATAPTAPARAAAVSHLTRLRAHAVLRRAEGWW